MGKLRFEGAKGVWAGGLGLLLLGAGIALTTAAPVPPARLLADLNQAEADYDIYSRQPMGAGSRVYFRRCSVEHGCELWSSDGSAAGTGLVRDIYAGAESSWPAFVTAFQGELYFTARDGTSRLALWKSDGTSVGTVRVRYLDDGGVTSGAIQSSVVFEGKLYLLVYEYNNWSASSIWRTDGTAAGTELVHRVGTADCGSRVTTLTASADSLFFSLRHFPCTGKRGLYRMGADASPVTVWDSEDGPIVPTVHQGYIYWLDEDHQLWRGTAAAGSAEVVTQIDGLGFPVEMVSEGNLLFIAGSTANGGHLWSSDGTAAGTQSLMALSTGPRFPYPSLDERFLAALDGRVYFANGDAEGGTELWSSDGSVAGTQRVKDIRPGPQSSAPRQLERNGPYVYFNADDGAHGIELWRTDGTAGGTLLVKDLVPGAKSSRPELLTTLADDVSFFATGAGTLDLWRSDGDAAGTAILESFDLRTAGSNAAAFAELNGSVYFVADGRLWRTDGTNSETVQAPDLPKLYPSELRRMADALLFEANDPSGSARRLWRSDGTTAGTLMLGSMERVRVLTEVDGLLFFSGYDSEHGYALWKSDGTEAGTQMVVADAPGYRFAVLGNRLYLDFGYGSGLWGTDGTAQGTWQVSDLDFDRLKSANGRLYFSGSSLWKTDGIGVGATLLKDHTVIGCGGLDLYPGLESSEPCTAAFAGHFYFASHSVYGHDEELWRTDGTPQGTQPVFSPDSVVAPSQFAHFNDAMFFSGLYRNQWHLMRMDPGGASTALRPLSTGSMLPIPEIGGALMTASDYDEEGIWADNGELWVTDGTCEGTRLLQDLYPGMDPVYARTASSRPDGFKRIGDTIYFSAEDRLHGREPWVMRVDDLVTYLAETPATNAACDPKALPLSDALARGASGGSGGAPSLPLLSLMLLAALLRGFAAATRRSPRMRPADPRA